MEMFTALDVSQEDTAICVVTSDGTMVAEAKVPTCPDVIADWLARCLVAICHWHNTRYRRLES
jgi:hypothetical protein